MTNEKQKYYTGIYDKVFKAVLLGSDKELTKWFIKLIYNDYVNKVKYDIKNNFINEVLLGRTRLPVKNVESKASETDSIIYVNDDIVMNIEVDSTFTSITRLKNMSYMTSIYTDLNTSGEAYTDKFLLLSVDITCDIPDDILLCDTSIYLMYNECQDNYVRNFVKFVYNVDRIKRYWYNGDAKKICKYTHIIMLLLDSDELLKLEEYVDDDTKEMIERYRKELDNMNLKDWRYKRPISPEREAELVKNGLINIGREEGLKEGIEKGIEQGIEKGIEKTQKENVKNMIRKKLDVSFISECLGIPVDKVKQIMSSIVL